ncbi:MAG: DNA translocase FtsK 4TM domain-containing protein [Eubacteriales bacterium]
MKQSNKSGAGRKPAAKTNQGKGNARTGTSGDGRGAKKHAPASSDSLVHQILPYLYAVVAVFLLVCFFFIDIMKKPDAMGFVGKGIHDLMLGLFGVGAFLIPLFVIYLAYAWRKSIDAGQAGYKIFFSVLELLLFSSLLHVFTLQGGADETFSIAALWKNGCASVGGGVVGGLLGQLFFLGLRFAGSLIVLIAAQLITLMFLFGMTPDNIALYIKYCAKLREEKKLASAGEDPAFINKPRFTPKEPVKTADEETAAARRRKRTFDVEIDPDTETDASAEDLGLEFAGAETAQVDQSAYDAALAEVNRPTDETVSKPDRGGIEDGIAIGNAFAAPENEKEIDDSLDALFAEKSEHKKEENGELPKKAESDDDFLTVKRETITDIPAEKPVTGEQIRAEILPPISLLSEDKSGKPENFTAELRATAEKLQETLLSFNVKTKIVGYSRGPTVTRYELQPESGTRVRSIANLVDDISLNLAAVGVRIEAPIPGKSAVGIEVPNKTSSTVYLRSLIESPKFRESKSNLTACLGADVAGNPIIFDIAKMPHLLIAGATGMGKSVCINSIIISLLYKSLPRDVKLLLIDPKKVEFNIYKDIPHLIAPIVCDPKKSAGALIKMVEEMERRFELIEEVGVRDLKSYNEITADDPDREHLPQIVIIIDELADLMMTTPQDVENSICRLAQKARAAGMHIIIGTQRPSVDVITGLIKANIPSRIAFTVASQVDSRTIIDIAGAEKLIGRGDMLYAPVGASKPIRVQGAFVSDGEVEAVCDYIRTNTGKAEYDTSIVSGIEEAAARLDAPKKGGNSDAGALADDGSDPMLRPAIELAIDSGKISTSLIQRRLSLGYGRAAKLIDKMEQLGYVSPQDGQKPREVLITKQMYMEMVVNDEIKS